MEKSEKVATLTPFFSSISKNLMAKDTTTSESDETASKSPQRDTSRSPSIDVIDSPNSNITLPHCNSTAALPQRNLRHTYCTYRRFIEKTQSVDYNFFIPMKYNGKDVKALIRDVNLLQNYGIFHIEENKRYFETNVDNICHISASNDFYLLPRSFKLNGRFAYIDRMKHFVYRRAAEDFLRIYANFKSMN